MEQSSQQPDTQQILMAKKLMQLENQMKGGVNNFFWIAGLSLVNTIFYLTNGAINFAIGLGITQLIDGIAQAVAKDVSSTSGTVVSIIAISIDIALAGMFILFGVLGRKRFGKVILFGAVLYTMDALIFLTAGDWSGLFVHVLILVGLVRGYFALRELNKLEEGYSTGGLTAVQPLIAVPPATQVRTPEDNKKRSRNLLIFTLVLLVPFGIFLAIFLLAIVSQ
jgi:hypothetical protein